MDGETRLQTQLLCSDTVRPCTEVASQQCDTVQEEECQELPGPETCVMEYEETCNKVRT